MAINFGDAAMAFGSGVIEADAKNTKENLLIRGEELRAKRDAVIAMKKSKYEYDLNNYDKNKSKYDGLNAVSTKLNTGAFNFKEGETGFIKDTNNVDTFKFGEAFLEAKHGQDWMVKQKAYLSNDGDSSNWIKYVKGVGENQDLKKEIGNIDYKSRQVMEGNYLNSLDKIETKYASALKDAKNDSVLVKAILGKKKEEIANLDIDIVDDKKTLTTIDSAEIKTNSIDTENINTETTSEIVNGDTETTSSGIELTYISTDTAPQMTKTFKTEAVAEIKAIKNYKYSDKEPTTEFSSWVLSTVPEASTKKYFATNDRGDLVAKDGIIDAHNTFNSLLKNSAFDLNTNSVFIATNGDTSKIANVTGFNAREQLAEKHIEQYGNWFEDGAVFGKNGNVGNLLKKNANVFSVPSQSIIDMNTNSLKGFNVIIPDKDNVIPAEAINNFTSMNAAEGINMNTRKYVGLVYTKALEDMAQLKVERDGGSLEQQMNIIQKSMQNDRTGNGKYATSIRDTIAASLGLNKETEVATDSSETSSKFSNSVAPAPDTPQSNIVMLTDPTTNKEVPIDLSIKANVENLKSTSKGREILQQNGVLELSSKEISNIDASSDSTSGDSSVAEQVANATTKEKIKPSDVGIGNPSGYFETLDSIKAILPNDMSGQEIMDKYNIAFPINKNTKYSSSK
tara:strand:+ start:511 stop:2547 length:2037 start_codon:yes stop_codon:yes gene_type:complete